MKKNKINKTLIKTKNEVTEIKQKNGENREKINIKERLKSFHTNRNSGVEKIIQITKEEMNY